LAFQDDFVGKVEGDDGICKYFDVPDSLIQALGLKLKMDKSENFGHAKFCGNICDVDALKIVSDPLKVLRNFFVLPRKYKDSNDKTHNSLLRAKALSLLYNLNGCPIVSELCHAVLDRTKGFSVDRVAAELGTYKSNYVNAAIAEKVWMQKIEVHHTSRVLVEERFGVPIQEQLRIENEIRTSPKEYFRVDLSLYLSPEDLDHAMNLITNDVLPFRSQVKLPAWIDEVIERNLKGVTLSRIKSVVRKFKDDVEGAHFITE